MSPPDRISCSSADALPSPRELSARADGQSHVVLHLPPGSDAAAVVDGLKGKLSDELRVFVSGEDCVTIKRVISEAVVVENADAICAAAREFRRVANQLMARLVAKLNIPRAVYTTDPLLRVTLGERGAGWLGLSWRYGFHGMECRFKNRWSGQVVEVRLGFGDEFGVLDPYFFHIFLRTTRRLAPVAALFKDSFHDPDRAFEILERRGRLKGVTGRFEHIEFQGVVAPD
jgi:hypothetical protein